MRDVSEASLMRMIDRDAIQDCLARYCRGIDRRNREMLEGVYWQGAFDDHVTYVGDAEGFIDWVLPLLESTELTQHFLGQSVILLKGDSAAVETYFNAYHRIMIEGVLTDVMMSGRYVDRFEKRGTEWRIGYRRVLGDWHRSAPSPAEGWRGFAMGPVPAASIGAGGAADASSQLLAGYWS